MLFTAAITRVAVMDVDKMEEGVECIHIPHLHSNGHQMPYSNSYEYIDTALLPPPLFHAASTPAVTVTQLVSYSLLCLQRFCL